MTPEQQKIWDLLKKTPEEIAAEAAAERFRTTLRDNLRNLRQSIEDEMLDRANKHDS